MLSVNIIDNQFSHGTSLGSGDLSLYPKYFHWNRVQDATFDHGYVFITEGSFINRSSVLIPKERRIAFIIEPKSINPTAYDFVKKHYDSFAYILSHDQNFVKELNSKSYLLPKALYYPFGGCWIKPEDRKIYPKTKFMSIIASGKRETEGHRLRHEIIEKYASKYGIDVYGRGYNPIEYKLDALKDYRYSIVIENEQSNGWFTEKLIDCLVCGTIPLYWGALDIKNYFPDISGMDINESNFDSLLSYLSNNRNYESERILQFTLIEKSFNDALGYTCPEDWIFENYKFLFE